LSGDGDVVDGSVVYEDPGGGVECGAVIEFSTYAAVAIAYNICIHGMAKADVCAVVCLEMETVGETIALVDGEVAECVKGTGKTGSVHVPRCGVEIAVDTVGVASADPVDAFVGLVVNDLGVVVIVGALELGVGSEVMGGTARVDGEVKVVAAVVADSESVVEVLGLFGSDVEGMGSGPDVRDVDDGDLGGVGVIKCDVFIRDRNGVDGEVMDAGLGGIPGECDVGGGSTIKMGDEGVVDELVVDEELDGDVGFIIDTVIFDEGMDRECVVDFDCWGGVYGIHFDVVGGVEDVDGEGDGDDGLI